MLLQFDSPLVAFVCAQNHNTSLTIIEALMSSPRELYNLNCIGINDSFYCNMLSTGYIKVASKREFSIKI